MISGLVAYTHMCLLTTGHSSHVKTYVSRAQHLGIGSVGGARELGHGYCTNKEACLRGGLKEAAR